MHSATPPLPLSFGDLRVTLPFWSRMAFQPDTQCWIWSGDTSPTGAPIHRRKSVWRHLFAILCGDPSEYGRAVRASCGNQLCVNPDHRVHPQDRQPQFRCPTCGGVTDQDLTPTLQGLPARSERAPLVYPEIKRELDSRQKRTGDGVYTLADYEKDNPAPPVDPTEPRYLPTGVWAFDPTESDKLCVIDDDTVLFWRHLGPAQRKEWLRIGPRGRTQVPLGELDKYEQ